MDNNFTVVAIHSTPPAEDVTKGIGRNHEITSALADLIDNSLEADATRVLIRFRTLHDKLVEVRIVDNGKGMDSNSIALAMRFGGQDHSGEDLGHFGIGLKAASLSQAAQLTVLSRTRDCEPVGRRIHDDRTSSVEELNSIQVTQLLDSDWGGVDTTRSGTVVVWESLRNAFTNTDHRRCREWIDGLIQKVTTDLGLRFHRFPTAPNRHPRTRLPEQRFGNSDPSRAS
jgi:hypothetical protein